MNMNNKDIVVQTDLTPDQQRRVFDLYIKTIWPSPLSALSEQETVYYKDHATSKLWDEQGWTENDLRYRVILRHGDNQCTIIHEGLDEEDVQSTFRSSVIRNMIS